MQTVCFNLHEMSRVAKTFIETGSRMVVARKWENGNGAFLLNGTISVLQYAKVLEILPQCVYS